jgi:hypothetical protein
MLLITNPINALAELEKSAALRRAPKGGLRHTDGTAYGGGQFIPAALWEGEKQAGKDGLTPLLADTADALQFLRLSYQQNSALALHPQITQQYKVPVIPLSTIEARLKATIRKSYNESFLLGKRSAGNLASITPQEAKALLKVRRDEFRFLKGFLSDLRTGGGTMEYGQRMEAYGNAVKEAYWLGWCLGDMSETRRIYWVRGLTSDSCKDCKRFEAHGPYTASEFQAEVLGKGYLPQGGSLACIGIHCKCRLEDA